MVLGTESRSYSLTTALLSSSKLYLQVLQLSGPSAPVGVVVALHVELKDNSSHCSVKVVLSLRNQGYSAVLAGKVGHANVIQIKRTAS